MSEPFGNANEQEILDAWEKGFDRREQELEAEKIRQQADRTRIYRESTSSMGESIKLGKRVGMQPDVVDRNAEDIRSREASVIANPRNNLATHDFLSSPLGQVALRDPEKFRRLQDTVADPSHRAVPGPWDFGYVFPDPATKEIPPWAEVFNKNWEAGWQYVEVGGLGTKYILGTASEEETLRYFNSEPVEIPDRPGNTDWVLGLMVQNIPQMVPMAQGAAFGAAIVGFLGVGVGGPAGAVPGAIIGARGGAALGVFPLHLGNTYLEYHRLAEEIAIPGPIGPGEVIPKDAIVGTAVVASIIATALDTIGASLLVGRAAKKASREKMAALLRSRKLRPLITHLAKQYVKSARDEGVTEFFQELEIMAFGEALIRVMTEQKGDFWSEDTVHRLLSALVGGVVVGLGFQAVASPPALVGEVLYFNAAQEQASADLNNTVVAINESGLSVFDPPVFQKFLQAQYEASGSSPDVYIDAKTLVEFLESEGIDLEQLIQNIPEIGDQLPAALAAHADISIRRSSYLTFLRDHHEKLSPELRHGASLPTNTEIAETSSELEKEVAESLGALIDEAAAIDPTETTEPSELDVLEQETAQKLIDAGGRPSDARVQARLHRARAERRAPTPLEVVGPDGVPITPVQEDILESLGASVDPDLRARIDALPVSGNAIEELLADARINLGDDVADAAQSYVDLRRASAVTPPTTLEQSEVAQRNLRKTKALADSVEGRSRSKANKHGLMRHLRTRSKVPKGRDKPLFAQTTMNSTAVRQLAAIDEVLARHPEATASAENWSAMIADALASNDVPAPPYALIANINGTGAVDLIANLSPGQIEAAIHGFATGKAFRDAYTSGEISVEDTGRLFLWGFLSRGVSPYTQESMFIDSFEGIGQWIDAAADGSIRSRRAEYEKWAKTVSKKGSGQPGAGAAHNLNAFGKSFLFKMSEDAGDGSGRSRLQLIHDMMSDPESTGPEIRRKFQEVGQGIGIDNKVVSFALLVAGFTDVVVLDRVQIRQMWNDGRFADLNLYDGFKDEGKVVTGSGLANLLNGARGLLIYEAIERGLAEKIDGIYSALGRPDDASLGRYHWESWVAASNQEASHSTIDAILAEAKGLPRPLEGVMSKEGEYGTYAYGARYGIDGAGVPYFIYSIPRLSDYKFTVAGFTAFKEALKKPKNGVVPTKFKVQESGNAPWFLRPEVNLERLAELAEEFGERYEADEIQGADARNGVDPATTNRLAADQPDAPADRGGDRVATTTLEQAQVPDAERPLGGVFYSALGRALRTSKQRKMTVAQLRKLLQKQRVKQDEIIWAGLDEHLEGMDPQDKVDLDALLEQISLIQVEEVVLGTGKGFADVESPEEYRALLEAMSAEELLTHARAELTIDVIVEADLDDWVIDELVREYEMVGVVRGFGERLPTKHEALTLPGGEDYRETLITLPTGIAESKYQRRYLDIAEKHGRSENPLGFSQYATTEEVEELHVLAERAGRSSGEEMFEGGHFGDVAPNVLVHVRWNSRTGPNGEKILFIEEIQDDWAKAGRELGYAGTTRELFSSYEDMSQVELLRLAAWNDANGDFGAFSREDLMAVIREWDSEVLPGGETVLESYNKAQTTGRLAGVPDRPFKASGASLMLALKRMIAYAAKNGFDSVAWTTGKIQFDRYDDSPIKGFEDIYDLMLVKGANKLGKQFGTKVGRVEIQEPQEDPGRLRYAVLENGEPYDAFESMEEAESFAENVDPTNARLSVVDLAEEAEVAHTVHNLPITDALRASVEKEGLSLFQAAAAAEGPRGGLEFSENLDKVILSLTKSHDLSTVLHEFGHLWFLEMLHDIRSGVADEKLQIDVQTALDYFGLEENMARALEIAQAAAEKWAQAESARLGTDVAVPEITMADLEGVLAAGLEYDPLAASLAGFAATGFHEVWAKSFEAYLLEGKAPSEALQSSFDTFMLWMLDIYKRLFKDLGVELTPEIRGVFDRMLATEEQIAAVRSQETMQPVFESAEAAGMSEEGFAEYIASVERGGDRYRRDQAKKYLVKVSKLRREARREARDRIRAMVEADVNSQPVHRAEEWLKTGVFLGVEEQPEDIEHRRLNRDALVQLLGDDAEAKIKRLPFGRFGVWTSDPEKSIDPTTVAVMFGFDNAEDLVNALLETPSRRELIVSETNRLLAEHYGDLSDRGAIAEEAAARMEGEPKGAFLLRELNILATRAGAPGTPQGVARRLARGLIKDRSLRQVRPDIFMRAEQRLMKELLKAVQEEDWEAAHRSAMERLVAWATTQEARKIRRDSQTRERYLKRLKKKPSQERIGHAGGQHLDQINQLLFRFGFRNEGGGPDRNDLGQWIIKMQLPEREGASPDKKGMPQASAFIFDPLDEDLDPAIQFILDEKNTASWRDLTAAQSELVHNIVKNIEVQARHQLYALTDANDRTHEDRIALLVPAMDASARIYRPDLARGEGEDQPYTDKPLMEPWIDPELKYGKSGEEFFAGMRKFASLLAEFDGKGADGRTRAGPWWELILRTMNERTDFEVEELLKAGRKFEELMKPILGGPGQRVKRAAHHKTASLSFGKIDVLRPEMLTPKKIDGAPHLPAMSQMGRIMAVLNMGNELNWQRMRDGFNLNDSDLHAIKDSLTKEEMDVVQGIWNWLNEYWPAISEKQRRVTGMAPKGVEAVPLETKYGTYPGGYFPISYEPFLSARSHADNQADAISRQMKGAVGHATTWRPHTKARVAKVTGRPLRLDFSVFTSHLTDVIHDLAWHEWLIDTTRLFNDERIIKAIKEGYGEAVLDQMRSQMQAISGGDIAPQKTGDRFFTAIRMGSAIAGMGWNMITGSQQVLGLSNSAERIGHRWVVRGMTEWGRGLAHQERTAKGIHARSSFMKNRSKTMQRELNEEQTKVVTGETNAQASFFYLIVKLQQTVDIPTWLGAYYKEMETGSGDEGRAIAMADQAVRDSQGSGSIADLADVQRGTPFHKNWSLYYGFFSATLQLLAERHRAEKSLDSNMIQSIAKNPIIVGRLAATHLTVAVVPAVAQRLMVDLMRDDFDEDETVLKYVAGATTAFYLNLFMWIREGAGFAEGYYDYRGPAGARIFTVLGNLAKELAEGVADRRMLRAAIHFFGVGLKLPAVAADRLIFGVEALSVGASDNLLAPAVGLSWEERKKLSRMTR